MFGWTANGLLNTSDIRVQDEDEIDTTSQFSLNYTNNINTSGHKLTIDFQYSDSQEIETAFINDSLALENNITTEDSKNTLIQTDYVLPIGENTQFEIGYRGEFQDLTSDFLVTRTPALDYNPSNNLVFKQHVNAIYSQFGSKINNFSYLLGLRTEITDVKVRLTNTGQNMDHSPMLQIVGVILMIIQKNIKLFLGYPINTKMNRTLLRITYL